METYYFTYGTIAVTALLSFAAFRNSLIADKMIFSTKKILRDNEYYRLVSSVFIHAGLGHFAFNMFSFYSFSISIEHYYGFRAVALIYFISGIAGSLFSLLLNRKNMNYLALGASGAVSGIIFSSIFLVPGGSVYIFLIPVAIPAWAFGILFVLASIYGIDRQIGNIGHDAHLGGALAGVLSAGLISPHSLIANPLLLGAIFIPAVVFIIFIHKRIK